MLAVHGGHAERDFEGRFCVETSGKRVLWIPRNEKGMQARLMILAHM